MRQPNCGRLPADLHAKLIPLAPKTRYAISHVSCPLLARNIARTRRVDGPASGSVARGVGVGSLRRPWAGARLRHRACRALDLYPDQSQGGPGHPHGCGGSLRLGPEIPARLWQAPAARRLGRRALVQAVSGGQLGELCAGDGHGRLRPGDLLDDQLARGRPAARLLCRADAGALSDLQFQGLQVQSGSAAARHPAADGAGLSACLRTAHRAGSPPRWR